MTRNSSRMIAAQDVLDWRLVSRVSRSFGLTLHLLPGEVRPAIALGYLVARLSDTFADGAATEAERELVRREAEVLGWLEASVDKPAIERVWATIRAGQEFDRVRFPGPALSPDELDHYTYLVAGSVGEFWTSLCFEKLPGWTRRSVEDMMQLGVKFGKGLQLVNILRDRAEDAARGRVYIAEGGLDDGMALARANLDCAMTYVRAVRRGRLRAACALPVLLGRATLDAVEANPAAARVKVSRATVWVALARSLLV